VFERGDEVRKSGGERDLTAFAADGFGMTDKEHATVEVDVLGALVKEFSTTHARVERSNDEVA